MVDGEKSVMTATGPLKDARFWSVEDPYLYDVYTILKVNGKVVDVNRIETGFRKTEFKGGAGTGGVYINDKFVYLKGFAERSADEWAGVGAGYPNWMHDYTASLIRECHGNYMRWMHISPQKVDADSLRPLRHHPGLPRRRQGSATSPAASGTSASRSCATPSSTSATTPASSSGRPATPSSPPST